MELLEPILHRLERRIHPPENSVSLRTLFNGRTNEMRPILPLEKTEVRGATPLSLSTLREPLGGVNEFFTQRAFNGFVAPLAYFAEQYGKLSLVDSSVRDIVSFKTTESHSRYLLGRLLNFSSQLRSHLDEIQDDEAKHVFKTLLAGSDIDFRLYLDEEKRTKFYKQLKDNFLVRLAGALSWDIDKKNPLLMSQWSVNPKIELPSSQAGFVNDVISRKIKVFEKQEGGKEFYDLLVQTTVPAQNIPSSVVDGFPVDWGDLFFGMRRVKIGNGIEVIKVSAGFYPGQTDNNIDSTKPFYPLVTIDFQLIGNKSSSVRGEKNTTTWDQEIPVRTRSVSPELRGDFLDVLAKVPKRVKRKLEKPVALGKNWETIVNPAVKIETATRVIWQAMEAELEESSEQQRIEENTLKRIEEGIKDLELDSLSPVMVRMITSNLLVAMFISPHRFLEYGKRSGLLEKFFPQLAKKTETDIDANIIDNWQFFDELLSLEKKYPDISTYEERIYKYLSDSLSSKQR